MARLTKAQRRVLERSTYDLQRFIEWIKSPDREIVSRGQSITKEVGSPLQFVENAHDRIKALHSEQFN